MAREDVLRVRLIADGAGQVKAEMLGVEQSMGRLEDRSKTAAGSMRLLKTAIGAISVGALAAVFKTVVDGADQMGKLAQASGTAVEELTGLAYGAKLSNVELNTLSGSLARLAKNATDTKNGTGEAKDAFKALGIEVTDASGRVRGTSDLLLDIADSFAGLEDGSEKTALAMRIFGDAGAQLIPFLNQGRDGIEALTAEAKAMGVVFDGDLSANAELLNTSMTRLGAAVQGALIQAFRDVIPVVAEMVDSFADFVASSGAVDVAATLLGGTFKTLVMAGSIVKTVFVQLGTLIGGVAAAFMQAVQGEFGAAADIMTQTFADMNSAAQENWQSIDRLWGRTETGASAAEKATRKTNVTLRDTGVTAKAAAKEIDAYEKRLQSLIDELDPTGKATREYLAAVADLDRAWVEGRISGEQYEELMQRLATDTDAVTKATEEAAKAQEAAAKKRAEEAERASELALEPYKNAIEGIQGAFTDMFESIFRGGVDSFKDLASEVKDVFIRLASEIASLLVFRPVLGAVAGAIGLGGSGSALASMTGGGSLGGVNPLGALSNFLGPAGSLLGIGALGGGLIGSLTGGNSLGASLGGAAGFYGGTLLGSGALGGVSGALAGVLGTAGNFVIPGLGLILGALAGGSLFGNKQPSNASAFGIVDLATGRQRQAPAERNSTDQTRQARDQLVDAILLLRQGVVDATGGTLSRKVNLDVGQRDGIQVSGIGAGQYSSPQTALSGIFRGMLNNLQGVDERFRQVFARLDTSNLEQAVQDLGIAASIIREDYVQADSLNAATQAINALNDAFDPLIDNATRLGLSLEPINAELARRRALLTTEFNDEIDRAILGITDPLAAALADFDKVAAERLDNARTLGADLVDVERLNALERQRIVEQANTQTNDDIRRFLMGITAGPGSYLSGADRLGNAETQFSSLLAAARGGDLFALENLTGAASNLLSATRDQFGSSAVFFERQDFVLRTLESFIGQQGSGATLTDIGISIETGNADLLVELRRLNAQVVELTTTVADQQAALDRLVAA